MKLKARARPLLRSWKAAWVERQMEQKSSALERDKQATAQSHRLDCEGAELSLALYGLHDSRNPLVESGICGLSDNPCHRTTAIRN